MVKRVLQAILEALKILDQAKSTVLRRHRRLVRLLGRVKMTEQNKAVRVELLKPKTGQVNKASTPRAIQP
jgi:hypothetical protein